MKIAHTIAFIFLILVLNAQESPFKAGASIGINLAQIDGDIRRVVFDSKILKIIFG